MWDDYKLDPSTLVDEAYLKLGATPQWQATQARADYLEQLYIASKIGELAKFLEVLGVSSLPPPALESASFPPLADDEGPSTSAATPGGAEPTAGGRSASEMDAAEEEEVCSRLRPLLRCLKFLVRRIMLLRNL